MTVYMIDTNVCSFILRKEPAPSKRLIQVSPRHTVVISVITYFELCKGAYAKNAPKGLVAAIEDFILRLTDVLTLDQRAAGRAAQVDAALSAKGMRIGEYDTLIAGHALSAECVLVTNNVSEFKRVRGLEIEDWSS
jgi:tRNA(fMet)-specific endonuclease VapC